MIRFFYALNRTIVIFHPPAYMDGVRTEILKLRIVGAAFIPGLWILSYLLLYIFYQLDHGFFTLANVDFVYEHNNGDHQKIG